MIGSFDSNTEALKQRYAQERSEYQKFADHIKSILAKTTRKRKVVCTIDARAKEVDSFVKKALVKNYLYDDINDKAGVRVIVTYQEDLPAIVKIVRALFDVIDSEKKSDSLDSNELGYNGIHFEVKLKQSYVKSISGQYNGMICEIQLHTQAQNLWSTISHKLLYKAKHQLPTEIQRDIYHLSALTGIFDNAVKNVKKDIFSNSSEAKILSILEKNYYRFRGCQSFNKELSIEIIQVLQELLNKEEKIKLEDIINNFVSEKEDKLEEFLNYYIEDDCYSLLLSQPEILLILERLENNKFSLRDKWIEKILPLKMLQDIAIAWGRSYRD